MSCQICGCKVIVGGVCVGCGADEGQKPIERKLTDRDRKTAKSLTQNPKQKEEHSREGGERGDRQFHGGQFHNAEW